MARGALQPSKGPFYHSTQSDVRVTFKLYPSMYKERRFRVSDCTLCVEFPGDHTSRQDRAQLQLVREAMEIFDRLSAVDNAAFVTLLSEFMEPDQPICDRPVWPTWECALSEPLAPEDLAASKYQVTWEELFGCPADPWESSPEFCDAMQKLEARGVEDACIRHNTVASAVWSINIGALRSKGDQDITCEKQQAHDPLTRSWESCWGSYRSGALSS